MTLIPVTPKQRSPLAPHLTRLAGNWALWRTVCLRGAGFPVGLLADLGAPALAGAADASIPAAGTSAPPDQPMSRSSPPRSGGSPASCTSYPASRCCGRPSPGRTGTPSRTASTCCDGTPRRPARATDSQAAGGARRELPAALCAKNETIGFFGPVGWSGSTTRLVSGSPPRSAGEMVAARVTYLEGWAVRAILARHDAALVLAGAERRPFIGVDGTRLRLPLGPPRPLTPGEAASTASLRRRPRRHRGNRRGARRSRFRDAGRGPGFRADGRMADRHRLIWRIDIPPQDIRPERSARKLLTRITDDAVREPAEQALAELTGARDEVAAAAGDADKVAAAMAGLEATFTRLSGAPPPAGRARVLRPDARLRGMPARRLRGLGAKPGRHPGGAGAGAGECPLVHHRLRRRVHKAFRGGASGSGPTSSARTWCRSPTGGCWRVTRSTTSGRRSSSRPERAAAALGPAAGPAAGHEPRQAAHGRPARAGGSSIRPALSPGRWPCTIALT